MPSAVAMRADRSPGAGWAPVNQVDRVVGGTPGCWASYAEAWYYLGEALGARARSPGGRPQDSEEAVQAVQKGLDLAPERQEFRTGFGHFLRRWSTRLMQGKQDPGPSLQRGLELA